MADITLVKISALPAAEQIGAEDLLPVVQEGATKAIAYGVIKDDIANELAPDATLSEAGKAADAKAVGDALALKADKTELTAEVSRIDAALNTKVNNTTYTAEVERIDDDIATKADAAATTAALATKANANDVTAALAIKADKTELTAGLATKQNTLTFDSAPTEGSTNPVTSGGVWEAIQTDKTLAVEDKAADAKAVGDAVAELKDAVDELENDIKNKADYAGVIAQADNKAKYSGNLIDIGYTSIFKCDANTNFPVAVVKGKNYISGLTAKSNCAVSGDTISVLNSSSAQFDVYTQNPLYLIGGETYYISFYAKSEDASSINQRFSVVRIYVDETHFIGTDPGSDYDIGSFEWKTNNKITTEYTEYIAEITVPNGSNVLCANRIWFQMFNLRGNSLNIKNVTVSHENEGAKKYSTVELYTEQFTTTVTDDGALIFCNTEATKLVSGVAYTLRYYKTLEEIKGKYRYIAPSFINTVPYSLVLLATNDLRSFDIAISEYVFSPALTNLSGHENSLRDPSVIKIDEWYYFVYTIIGFYTGSNEIGFCRTKNFIDFEELDNISMIPSSEVVYDKVWAPSWFRFGTNIYVVASGHKADSNTFETIVCAYDVDNHALSVGNVINVSGIDFHLYHFDGYYYAIGAGGKIYKSETINGIYEQIQTGLDPGYEADFVVRLDNGKYRLFRQQLIETFGTANLTYTDTQSVNEPSFGAVHDIEYTQAAIDFFNSVSDSQTSKYMHFVVYDFNNSNDNNNNFVD